MKRVSLVVMVALLGLAALLVILLVASSRRPPTVSGQLSAADLAIIRQAHGSNVSTGFSKTLATCLPASAYRSISAFLNPIKSIQVSSPGFVLVSYREFGTRLGTSRDSKSASSPQYIMLKTISGWQKLTVFSSLKVLNPRPGAPPKMIDHNPSLPVNNQQPNAS